MINVSKYFDICHVTATPLVRVTPTANPTEAAQTGCQTTPGGRAYGYLPGAPLTTTLAPPDLPGQRLVISGTVYASDCITPLPNVLVEVWHTDSTGRYDRSEPFILRAQMYTNSNGRHEFTTTRPGHYQSGDITRPAHIHYRVSQQGSEPLATRLLFADDPHLTGISENSRLVTSLSERTKPGGPIFYGTFDLILPAVPPAPTPEILTDEDL